MSASAQQSHEEHHDIYMAIPPPLVPPLVRQLGPSSSCSTTQLPTPASTNNSSFVSQAHSQWYMTPQGFIAPGLGSGSNQAVPGNQSSSSISFSSAALPDANNNNALPLIPPISTQSPPPPPSFSAQFLNRLNPFSTTTATDTSNQSPASLRQANVNSIYMNHPTMGLPPQTRRSHDSQAETTRAAAAAAIANTLSRGDPYLTRGESPYIPSSLSMLFSDPEVMQAQEELDRAHLHQQQQQLRQRYMDSQRSFSGEDPRDVEGELGQCDDDERTRLLSLPLGAQDETEGGYGFEVVVQDSRQDEEAYHPYATVLSRHDYLAPHEPSSSSPLFPSPLTTLGRFGRNSLLADSLEGQHAQAGRIWQDYGGAVDNLEQQHQANIRTPLNQSHGAYYHAVSNYHYSSYGNENNDNGASGSGTGSSTAQGNSGCVPLNGEQWRRQHGRGNSQQSYTSGNGYGSDGQHRDRSEDHWLWRMLTCRTCCLGCSS